MRFPARAVSKVTIYNHFGSKEALFTAVIANALDAPLGGTLVAAIDRLASTSPPDTSADARQQHLICPPRPPSCRRLPPRPAPSSTTAPCAASRARCSRRPCA
ncbi:TetR/AcrR family transcriptional regulator, partial [Streptomyces sp. NPDC000941]